jgi:hypothetical protein
VSNESAMCKTVLVVISYLDGEAHHVLDHYKMIDVPKGVDDMTLLYNPTAANPDIISEYETREHIDDHGYFIPLAKIYFYRMNILDRFRRRWHGALELYVGAQV